MASLPITWNHICFGPQWWHLQKKYYNIKFVSHKELVSVKVFSFRWAILLSLLKITRSRGQWIEPFSCWVWSLLMLWASGKEKQHSYKKQQTTSNIYVFSNTHRHSTPCLVPVFYICDLIKFDLLSKLCFNIRYFHCSWF